MDLDLRMHAERTPNPNSIKWVLGRVIVEGGASAHFEAPPGDEVSPLATRLFGVAGVTVVFMASNFVTITKAEGIEWADLAEPIVDTLKDCLGSGGDALGPAFVPSEVVELGGVEARIRQVLEEVVRPAVAMDGGDVVFSAFRDGIVELHLQGSCSGCPSAAATLKHGIEARLREAIPEVREVVAL